MAFSTHRQDQERGLRMMERWETTARVGQSTGGRGEQGLGEVVRYSVHVRGLGRLRMTVVWDYTLKAKTTADSAESTRLKATKQFLAHMV